MKNLYKILLIGAFLLLLAGCSNRSVISQNTAEIFSKDILNLQEAKEPEIVELKDGDTYNLTAEIIKKEIGNKEVKMFGYNGSVPGPFIKVQQGSEITINFTNNTDVPTTIHSHGVRLDNEFDGVPDVTQEEVKPGESFTYKIKFPDQGIYWYHPHIREDYAQELGLYGNYIVESSDENYWNKVNREIPLFIDDILLDSNGEIESFPEDVVDHALMGRFGNMMLVNGETNYSIDAEKGEVIRFAITNAANTRVFNLSIPGAKMKLVGSDGGRYEKETFADNIILGPSERAIIEVYFEKDGDYEINHKTPEKTYNLANIKVSNEDIAETFASEFENLRQNTDINDYIKNLDDYFTKAPDKKLKLSIDMMGMGNNMNGSGHMGHMMSGSNNNEKIEWEDSNDMMNEISNNELITWEIIDEETGNKNEDIDWTFKTGEFVKIQIFNDPDSSHPMQHPIHFHGQRFIVLATNDIQNENLVWKDTTLVQMGDTVDILVEMSNPGKWMAHCHIAEHLHSDMMFGFEVE